MAYEQLGERLLEFLNTWGKAVEVAPGRIEMSLRMPDGHEQTVEVRMTADQWDDMVSVMWGSFDEAAQEVRRSMLRLGRHERYLLFGDYELNPSTTPELPVDSRIARLDELARKNPGGIGRWVALDREGNVTSVFGEED